MKLSKNLYLIIGTLLIIDFFYSLIDKRDKHELFIWIVNIWIYRSYRFFIAIIFIKLYFDQKKIDSKKMT